MATMNNRRLQINLRPAVLTWARERAGFSADELASKLNVKPERVQEWERSGKISVAQVDRLSHTTHTPVGFLHLEEPPEDVLPITDFRTIGDRPLLRPSPNLLETVYEMQRRQAWMRSELIGCEEPSLSFVSSFTDDAEPATVAESIRVHLGLAPEWAASFPNWETALRSLRDSIESIGVLVVINGIVGNNTSRRLDPDEFRGFALVDEYAPLIFVNNSDYKSAQMFTLVHELAHIFVGEDGVSNFEDLQPVPHETEIFCNSVAAEFLIPGEVLRNFWSEILESGDRYQTIARRFKVSVIVAARRALDLQLIDQTTFYAFYQSYLADERRRRDTGIDGGNFWNSQNVRVGRRFGAAVVRAVNEGRLAYREAFALTGLRGETFDKLANRVGVRL